MTEIEVKSVDNWTVIAALIGFLSGAGVMSHADLIQIYSNDLFGFIEVSGEGISIYGRQMVSILTAIVAYISLLILLGFFALYTIHLNKDLKVRMVAIAGMLLIISFLGTSSFAINRGYNEIDRKIENLRIQKEESQKEIIPTWIWK